MKLIFLLMPLALGLLAGSAVAQQGALNADAPRSRQAFSSYDTVVQRVVSQADAALGPPRDAVTLFDADAFRASASADPISLSKGAPISENVAAAPLVLPKAFISTVQGVPSALSANTIDTSTAYFRESAIGLGFYYGYEAQGYRLDVTARTVETTDGTTKLGPSYGRFPLSETREGFFGTVHAANVSYAIEITCGPGDTCITNDDLQALYVSLLSCEADGNCYDIEGNTP